MKNLIYYSFALAVFCSFCQISRAQGGNFIPATEDLSLLTGLSTKYQRIHQEELDKLPSKNKKDFTELYNQRWDNIKEKFDKKEIYTAAAAQQYLDALVAEIVKGNPSLRGHAFNCYFSRTWIPNASYVGQGIILFNMGLFYRLNDESEIAFVLCHEIGHYLLRHQENSIDKYVTTINSGEVQAELRKIKGSEYRKNEQLQKLVKGLTFDSRRHSRDHESQADSMAVELLRHTAYDLSGAQRALALLDVIDRDTLDTGRCLPALFNARDYPFQKKWIAKEEGLLGGHAHLKEDKLDDSLKTHPDCQTRIKLLTPMISGAKGAGNRRFVVDSLRFGSFRNTFRYEAIEYAYEADDYSRSLFYAMELLTTRPGDAYLVAQTGKIMNGLYAAQKKHTLSKVADLPAPYYPSNYNLLLQFIQNLYPENFALIGYHFLNRLHPQLDSYTPFRQAYEQSSKIAQQER